MPTSAGARCFPRVVSGRGDLRSRSASLTSPMRRTPKWKTLAASTASAPASTAGAKSSSRPAPPLAMTGTPTAPRTAVQHLDVEAGARAVGVHRVEQHLADAELLAALRPLDRVDAGAAAAAVGGDLEAARRAPPARRASTDSTSTWLPKRRAISRSSSGRAIAAVLTPTLSAPARSSRSTSSRRAHSPTDGQRDEDLLGGAAHHVVGRLAAAAARGDVEEHELVGALGVVEPGHLDRVAGVAQLAEVDALDDPAGVDVEAGHDTDGDAHGSRRYRGGTAARHAAGGVLLQGWCRQDVDRRVAGRGPRRAGAPSTAAGAGRRRRPAGQPRAGRSAWSPRAATTRSPGCSRTPTPTRGRACAPTSRPGSTCCRPTRRSTRSASRSPRRAGWSPACGGSCGRCWPTTTTSCIDTHGDLGNLTLSAVAAADSVLTVFTSDPGSALGAARVAAFLEQHRRFENTSAVLRRRRLRAVGQQGARRPRGRRRARGHRPAAAADPRSRCRAGSPAPRSPSGRWCCRRRPAPVARPTPSLADEVLASYARLVPGAAS